MWPLDDLKLSIWMLLIGKNKPIYFELCFYNIAFKNIGHFNKRIIAKY